MKAAMNQPVRQIDVGREYPGVRIWARSRRMQHEFGEFIVWLVRLWL